jgi:Ca-activated chloride channel homolog
MTWLNPIAHFAWIGVIIAASILWISASRRRHLSAQMGHEQSVGRLGADAGRGRWYRPVILVSALSLLVIAAAGPRMGSEPREVELIGLDLVIALDVSRSMLAEDVAPSRLTRAREEILRLTTRLGDDRVGLITFAGDAYLQMPLTADRDALRLYLDAASPDMIPTQGTNFASMLAVAARVFGTAGVDEGRSRVLLVVSDGEDHESGLEPRLRQLRDAGVKVLTLGIGTREGGPIPIDRDGQTVFHRTRSGEIVNTRLEDRLLRDIGGVDGYFEITRASSGADRLGEALNRLERHSYGTIVYDSHVERYQLPLMAALILLIVEAGLRDRRRRPQLEEVPA